MISNDSQKTPLLWSFFVGSKKMHFVHEPPAFVLLEKRLVSMVLYMESIGPWDSPWKSSPWSMGPGSFVSLKLCKPTVLWGEKYYYKSVTVNLYYIIYISVHKEYSSENDIGCTSLDLFNGIMKYSSWEHVDLPPYEYLMSYCWWLRNPAINSWGW